MTTAEDVQRVTKTKTVRINVTAMDIKRAMALGGGHCGYTCPIARAITRRVSGRVHAGFGELQVGLVTLRLPDDASRFIDAFDCSHKVRPFVFDLELPVAVLR